MGDDEVIHLRVEAGEDGKFGWINLPAGRYRLTLVVPERLRSPDLFASWSGGSVPIEYRDEG